MLYMLLIRRLLLFSNPTLSAKLFKINKLLRSPSPLSWACFVFGMSDMQFCKEQVRAVKAKTDRLGISFSIGEVGILLTHAGGSASEAPNKKPHRASRRLRFADLPELVGVRRDRS